MRRKKTRLEIIQDKSNLAIKETNDAISILGKHAEMLFYELNELQSTFDKIRNVPDEEQEHFNEIKMIRMKWELGAREIDEKYKAAKAKDVGAGFIGVGAGVSVATMGPSMAMGIATTFGVASTGTPIAALHGAAATYAALAWLGGGALAAEGGGMAAGSAFLSMFGPIGWGIAAASLTATAIHIIKTKKEQERIEKIFENIYERDIKNYKLATIEINQRVQLMDEERAHIFTIRKDIETFGTDYSQMNECQQYKLGSFVNDMYSSSTLLTEPIKGLQPKFVEHDYEDFYSCLRKQPDSERFQNAFVIEPHKDVIISLANLLYMIKLDERDRILLNKLFKKDKNFLDSMKIKKKDCIFR